MQPVLADLPVESLVHAHQEGYYRAIKKSTGKADAAPFITFMLSKILNACKANTPQVALYVTPQVKRLLSVMRGVMSRQELMKALGLKDVKHFRRRYLRPAIEAGLIEMTQPESPRSPTQGYRLTEKGQMLLSQWEEVS